MSFALAMEPTDAVMARHMGSAPVDVEAMARDMGLAVYRDDSIGRGIAGKIVRSMAHGGRSGYAIYLNASDGPRRQRFTLAHEIAHYLLHRDLIGDGLVDDALYRSGLGEWYERQANRMAADILLPGRLVKSVFQTQKSLAALANTFDVSEDALRIQMKELRLAP